jgi:hypothetical protein
MIRVPLPSGLTTTQIKDYQNKLIRECEIAEDFRIQSQLASQRYGLSLTDISAYQALRYIERNRYDQGRERDLPVEVTYQVCYSDYDRPVSERSTIIWRNWSQGISQLDSFVERFQRGSWFELNDLLRAHAGFYQLSDEFCPRSEGEKRTGHNNLPFPGQLKPSNFSQPDRYWWKFENDEEARKAIAATDSINSFYRELGILGRRAADEGTQFSDVLKIRRTGGPTNDGSVTGFFAIWSGDTRDNSSHLEGLLNILNVLNGQARKGGHMIWHTTTGRMLLLTPGELAFLAQQYLVQIHPFSEGNGRLARFLQESILRSFDLPHGPSGDLMDDDVLSKVDDYYQLALSKMKEVMSDTDRCLVDVFPEVMRQNGIAQLSEIDPVRIPYECRIIRR